MWEFLKDKRRRDTIGWVASGVAAVVAGGWALYIHLNPDMPRPNGPTGDCNFANNAPVNANNGNITLDCANMKAVGRR